MMAARRSSWPPPRLDIHEVAGFGEVYEPYARVVLEGGIPCSLASWCIHRHASLPTRMVCEEADLVKLNESNAHATLELKPFTAIDE